MKIHIFFFFSSRRRHTRWTGDWSSDVCSSDLLFSGEHFVAVFEGRRWSLQPKLPQVHDPIRQVGRPTVAGRIPDFADLHLCFRPHTHITPSRVLPNLALRFLPAKMLASPLHKLTMTVFLGRYKCS